MEFFTYNLMVLLEYFVSIEAYTTKKNLNVVLFFVSFYCILGGIGEVMLTAVGKSKLRQNEYKNLRYLYLPLVRFSKVI